MLSNYDSKQKLAFTVVMRTCDFFSKRMVWANFTLQPFSSDTYNLETISSQTEQTFLKTLVNTIIPLYNVTSSFRAIKLSCKTVLTFENTFH